VHDDPAEGVATGGRVGQPVRVRSARDADDPVGRLIASQREFYDLRAPDFGDETVPDRPVSGRMPDELARALIDEFAPSGDVLELACGTGAFTRELVRHARSVTAVDGSARMLERNRREVGDSTVRYVEADIFDLQPDRRYDAVFFGFWLSHVPPDAFDGFWSLLGSCLRPGGRVAFVDEDDRGVRNDDLRVRDGVPVASRTLRDGRRFDVVKLYWDPRELEARIRSLDWRVDVRRVGETFLYGTSTA
jgi:SAM-dependent methyltransferase